jgi:hypothetical protein
MNKIINTAQPESVLQKVIISAGRCHRRRYSCLFGIFLRSSKCEYSNIRRSKINFEISKSSVIVLTDRLHGICTIKSLKVASLSRNKVFSFYPDQSHEQKLVFVGPVMAGHPAGSGTGRLDTMN